MGAGEVEQSVGLSPGGDGVGCGVGLLSILAFFCRGSQQCLELLVQPVNVLDVRPGA
jgi:hypothetical protein